MRGHFPKMLAPQSEQDNRKRERAAGQAGLRVQLALQFQGRRKPPETMTIEGERAEGRRMNTYSMPRTYMRRRPRPAVYSCMENQEKRSNPGQPIYRVLWRGRQHTLRLIPILSALCLAERASRGSEKALRSRPTARPSECPRRAGPGSNRGVCVCV